MIYMSHLLNDGEMRQAVEQTEAGVESIEFSISENLDCLDKKICEYKKRLEYIGSRSLTLHGPFLDMNAMTYDSKIRGVTKYRFSQAYEAGMRLGAKKIIYHTGFLPGIYYLTGWAKRTAEFWNEFMDGKSGIQVLLENVYDPDPAPLVEVKKDVESSDFKLCLDIGHAHCYSLLPVKTWIQSFGAFTGHVHVHDNCGNRDEHLGLGNGNLPVSEILQELRKCLADIDCTIECNKLEDVMCTYDILNCWISL